MALLDKLLGGGGPAPELPIHPEDQDLVHATDTEWWSSVTLRKLKKLEAEDLASRGAFANGLMKYGGASKEVAVRRALLSMPWFYRNLEEREVDTLKLAGEDAGLPWILKGRIVDAIMTGDIKKSDLDKSSSMNALIRRLIRAGSI